MNHLLSSLKEICARYPLREKVLIVPGYGQGRELCEALARSGVGWVNLRPETTAGLAHQVAGGELAEKGITLLTGLLTTAVVEEVFHNLEEQKALRYFTRESSSPGLVRAIASSIYELRNCGVTGNCLTVSSFVSKDKWHDLAALLKAYERHLADYKYIDTPGLLSLALKLLSSKTTTTDTDAVYLLPPFLQLSPLEYELIKSLAQDRLIVLNTDPVYGIPRTGLEQKWLGFDLYKMFVGGSYESGSNTKFFISGTPATFVTEVIVMHLKYRLIFGNIS